MAQDVIRIGGAREHNLKNISLEIPRHRLVVITGLSGSGKSSLLKIMAGLDQPSNGDAILTPGYTVGILSQEPRLDEEKTVLENVQEGVADTMAKINRFNEISVELADPDADYDKLLGEMGVLQEQIDHLNAWDLDSQLEQAMDALRCPPPEADVSVLSGGEKRRVALCKLLLQQPDLLLLDEPTNHLDAESVNWLEQHLEKYPGTVIAITHDRYFLDRVATRIVELDRGRLVERLARVDVDAEEQLRLLPRVEVRARGLPVDPAGPAEAVRAVRHRLDQRDHPADLAQRAEVVVDLDRVDRRRGDALHHQPLAVDPGREVTERRVLERELDPGARITEVRFCCCHCG